MPDRRLPDAPAASAAPRVPIPPPPPMPDPAGPVTDPTAAPPAPAPLAAMPVRRSRAAELHRATGIIILVRWVGVVFATVQIATYYLPHPPGALPMALASVGALALGNLVLSLLHRRTPAEDGVEGVRAQRRLAVAGLALDVVVASALVVTYTFDPDTAVWALLYFLPLEGALLFQLRGALLAMGAATVLYTLREVYGQLVYDIPFLAVSITFRMGIGLIVAWVAGAIASDLGAQRDELAAATDRLAGRTAELARANRQLRAAQEVQDEFIAVTNHELRTPLTAILGYATMLQRRWSTLDEEARQRSVELIALQSRRLHDLVEDVLTVSAARAGVLDVHAVPVRLEHLIRTAVEVADLPVTVTCPGDLWALGDPKRLGQVLVNLLSNARKYGAPPLSITARAEGDRVLVVVEDQGPGVPPAFVPHLFDRFTQASRGASRVAGGSGLGLAIVKDLVEAQGGAVWFEPAHPSGSRFCVHLRRSAPVTPVPPPPP